MFIGKLLLVALASVLLGIGLVYGLLYCLANAAVRDSRKYHDDI